MGSLFSTGGGSILDLVLHAGIVVKITLFILLFFSIFSWAIIFYKFRVIRRAERESDAFLRHFRKSKRLDAVFNGTRTLNWSPLANIFREGYAELTTKESSERNPSDSYTLSTELSGIDNISRALRRASASEITKLESFLGFLATTGSTTPFIGLFGTVWGIMDSFHSIGLRGSASLSVVAPGISEALVATAAGLAAAIPAVVAYNYYLNKIKTLAAEMDSFSQELLNIIDRNFFNKNNRGI